MEKIFDTECLVNRIKEGDLTSFKVVYQLYWRKLYNVAFHIVESDVEAEDIVQDVFSSVWYRREHLKIKVSIENYLVKAVKYSAFFHLKIQNRKKEFYCEYPSGNNIEEGIAYNELEILTEKLLQSLSSKTRHIFSLSRFDGLTYLQIAETLGVSVKTVEYHISIALKKFSKELVASVVIAVVFC